MIPERQSGWRVSCEILYKRYSDIFDLNLSSTAVKSVGCAQSYGCSQPIYDVIFRP